MRLETITRIEGEIAVLTGLHIGAGDIEMRIGGVDNPVIRSVRSAEPYIPGSSLKGKIRSLLEWRSGSFNKDGKPFGWEDLGQSAPHAKAVEAIVKLFGAAGDTRNDDLAMRIGPTRVSFYDAMLIADPVGSNLPVTEIKSENMIDRIRGVAQHPRQTERVAAGVRFAFKVAVKKLEGDPDLTATLLQGMRLLELDSLGGSGSRGYGKVKFEKLTRDGADIQAYFDAIDAFSASAGEAA